MADWLVSIGIRTVAMESTGVYWVPVYEVLEERGLEVIVANAREARAVPGRKSDVNDAQWLQRLHSCGLLRPSFRPARDIAVLRAYLRLRERHVDYASAHIQHTQKALTNRVLRLALPELDQAPLAWGYLFSVGAMISAISPTGLIRLLSKGKADPDDVTQILELLIPFLSGGSAQIAALRQVS